MARAYGDVICAESFCSAYDQGGDTLEELAERFVVSVGWAKKISAQRRCAAARRNECLTIQDASRVLEWKRRSRWSPGSGLNPI